MVKPPKIRHSKSRREPMTIDLRPGEISRIETAKAEEAQPADAPAAEAATQPVEAEATTEAAAKPIESVEASSEAHRPASEDAATQSSIDPDAVAAGASPEPKSEQPAEEDTTAFMGSEWPPEPDAAAAEKTPIEERVAHAFGRDPDSPPPTGSGRGGNDAEEPPIRVGPAPGRSGISFLAAGVIGGVVALVGAAALQFAGVLPAPGTDVVVPIADDAAIASLKADLAALKGEVDQVKKAGAGGDTSALSQSVSELSSGVQGLTKALDQVKADVAALQKAVSQGDAGGGAALEALNQKIAALEASIQKLGEAGPGVRQEAIDAINQKLGAVEQAAAAANDAMKSGADRLAALEQSVKTLSDQVARQADQPKVALAIAAAALKSAIERGGPFTAEVETFAAIAPDSPELPELRDIAAKGIASKAELEAGMDDAATVMIAASEQPGEDAGFWESLFASAESLIKVRPIGEVEGDTVPAKVARMEVAVKAGDLAKALAEYDTLPEAPKAAGQAFADLIRTRVRADELVAKALAGAMKA
jgi:hypothetical protein